MALLKTCVCVCPNVPIPFQVMSHDSKCLCGITSAVSFSHRHAFISSSSIVIINGNENRLFRFVAGLVISAGRRCNNNDGGHYSFRIHRENNSNKNKKEIIIKRKRQ